MLFGILELVGPNNSDQKIYQIGKNVFVMFDDVDQKYAGFSMLVRFVFRILSFCDFQRSVHGFRFVEHNLYFGFLNHLAVTIIVNQIQ